jgi:hypothetical protein
MIRGSRSPLQVQSSERRASLTARLSLTNALADANIDRQKAERIATEIFDAIHENVAAKQDLQRVETSLRAELQRVETSLRAELQSCNVSRRR